MKLGKIISAVLLLSLVFSGCKKVEISLLIPPNFEGVLTACDPIRKEGPISDSINFQLDFSQTKFLCIPGFSIIETINVSEVEVFNLSANGDLQEVPRTVNLITSEAFSKLDPERTYWFLAHSSYSPGCEFFVISKPINLPSVLKEKLEAIDNRSKACE